MFCCLCRIQDAAQAVDDEVGINGPFHLLILQPNTVLVLTMGLCHEAFP